METQNSNDVVERSIIKLSVPTEDATCMEIFSKRYPIYGIRVHVRETDDANRVSKIEVHQSNVSKSEANSKLNHFMLGYAKEF